MGFVMLESLFCPETVAVIGASGKPTEAGFRLVDNLVGGGFKGRIVPVADEALSIHGIACLRTLRDFSGNIDLALVAVPKPRILEAVQMAVDAKATAVIVTTSGFHGTRDAELKQTLVDLCLDRGARLLGPGSLGIINTERGLNASLIANLPSPGSISIVSQSSAICNAILDMVSSSSQGVAKLVSLGDKSDLTEHDFLRFFAEDAQTKVVAGYLESIDSGDAFVKAAEHIAASKPVVLVKAGSTASGALVAQAHLGASVGADFAYKAAFRRSGVIRAETMQELIDFSLVLSNQPLPAGNRFAVLSNAGGAAIMAADATDGSNLKLARFEQSTLSLLSESAPKALVGPGTVDLAYDAGPDEYSGALEVLLGSRDVDAVLVVLAPTGGAEPTHTAASIVSTTRRNKKPVVAAFMGGQSVESGRRTLVAAGIPEYGGPKRAVESLDALSDYAHWRRRPPRIVTRFPVNQRRVERILNRHIRTDRREIGELAAKEILRAYQFEIPEGMMCTSAGDAIEAAERIGYPIALKISSPDIIRKSEIDGVKLSLASPEQVRDAFDLMVLRVQRQRPDARLEGVYVEKMARAGREVILGMERDPHFGPMLMFGTGGTFVEMMRDVTFHLAPITAEEAMQMLETTRSFEILKEAGVELRAVVRGLQLLSQLATDFPQIRHLDINPFVVRPAPEPAMVVGARVLLGS